MAITNVQTIIGPDGSATTSTTLDQVITVTAGDLLVGLVSYSASFTLSSVVDVISSTAATLVMDTINESTDNQNGSTFYFANVSFSGSRTIRATFSGAADFRRMGISEYSGIASGTSIDGHTGTFQASPGTLANALNSGNIVPV